MLTRAGILGAASGPQNLIQNGAFNSPDTFWALNAANISGGTLNFVNSGYGSAIQSTGPRWVEGATYAITYTVSNYTSGSVARLEWTEASTLVGPSIVPTGPIRKI